MYLLDGSVVVGIGVVVTGTGVVRRSSVNIDNQVIEIILYKNQITIKKKQQTVSLNIHIPGSVPSKFLQVGKFFGTSGKYEKDSFMSTAIPFSDSGRELLFIIQNPGLSALIRSTT